MNAIYSGCIPDPWLDVAIKLQKENNIKPVYWIGWNDNENELINTYFSDCTFHKFPLAWKGIFPKEDFKNIPELDGDLLKKYCFEENTAMKMMDRMDPTGHNFSFNERQQFFRHLLRHWLHIIKKYNVELVISPSIPHRVFDYALYVASKIKPINFLTFKMTVWPGYLIPINDIEDIPSFPLDNTDKNKLVSDFIKKNKEDYQIAEPYYMKKQKQQQKVNYTEKIITWLKKGVILKKINSAFSDAESYWKKRNKTIEDSRYLKIQKLIELRKGKTYKKELKNLYLSLCSKPDFSTKYIFVALHYQPEETSSPSGNIYVDQALMIETLLKYTSDDVNIYVKEHTSQFHPLMEGETGRNPEFYKQLLKFDRVKLISTDINSFKLIDNAVAVSTLTGTVGVESLIRHKPVLVFGTAWYEQLTNIFKIKSSQDLIKAIHIIEKGISFDDNLTESELNNIFNHTAKAYHYGNYAQISGINKAEAVNNLANYIALKV